MTLKEKFIPLVWFNYNSFNVHQNKEKDENSNKCVEIADNYAIEFAEWIHNNCVYYDGWNVRVPLGDKYSDVYNIEGLLEIFKKEKGYEQ